MRRTLLLIPHEVAGLPIFGFGWLLIGLAVLLALRLAWARSRREPVAEVLRAEGLMWGLIAAVIALILPLAEIKNIDGEPIGMAIRGYGVFLLVAIGSALLLAAHRAKRYGLPPETVYGLAPWAFGGGLLGARLFYVIQYHERFVADTWLATLRNMLVFTEGGLVVYGSIIGGFAASVWYIRRHRLPLLTLGDVIIPCIFVGIFFGRLGCLMNGCCYGGRCEAGVMALEFPPGSPVYQDQLMSGELLGMEVERKTRTVRAVAPGSLADAAGVRPGQAVEYIEPAAIEPTAASRQVPLEALPTGVNARIGGKVYHWPATRLPSRALPVRGAQVISSLSALGLAVTLLVLSRWIVRPGALMLVGFGGYAVVRFLLEWVRVDEVGRFGTDLSISQWVSVLVLIASIVGMVWLLRRPVEERSTSAAAT